MVPIEPHPDDVWPIMMTAREIRYWVTVVLDTDEEISSKFVSRREMNMFYDLAQNNAILASANKGHAGMRALINRAYRLYIAEKLCSSQNRRLFV